MADVRPKDCLIIPEKTEVVLFTRKRKTEEVVRLEYQGVKLKLSKEVKYPVFSLMTN